MTGVNSTYSIVNRYENGTTTGSTGGTAIQSNTIGAGLNNRLSMKISNFNSLTAQRVFNNGGASYDATSNALNAPTQDTSNPWTISINGKLNNANDILELINVTAILTPSE